VERENRADRDHILCWRDSEPKAADKIGLKTEVPPLYFGGLLGADLGIWHGLAHIVYHLPFQRYPGLQGDVEDGVLRHLDSLYRRVQEVFAIHVDLVGSGRHPQTVVAGGIRSIETDLLTFVVHDPQPRMGYRLAIGSDLP